MLIDEKKLSLYIENNLNVLFEGERGVGKTATIHKAFEAAGLRVKYFSAPTMDPWTDLVGVPTTFKRDDGKEVLRMVQPEDFVDDSYDVIFIDELNRAQPKVLNALMELIQFGSINGKKYGIKMIWAAINPWTEDGDYTVEKLDLAVKDRFQVQIKFPYKVDHDLFKKTFQGTGVVFAEWWTNQPANIQKEISPRRLFEATKFYLAGGDVEDILMTGNLEKLKNTLKNQGQIEILQNDFNKQKITNSKAILSKPMSSSVTVYLGHLDKLKFFFNEISEEWLSEQFTKNNNMYKNILSVANDDNNPKAIELIKSILATAKPSYINARKEELANFIPEGFFEKIKENSVVKSELSLKSGISNSKPVKDELNKMFSHFNYKGFTLVSDLNFHFNKTEIKRQLQSIRTKYQIDNPDNYSKIVNAIALRTAAVIQDYQHNVVDKHGKQSVTFNNLVDTLFSKEKEGMFTYKKDNQYMNDVADLIIEYSDAFKGLTTDEVKKKYNSAINNKEKLLDDILFPPATTEKAPTAKAKKIVADTAKEKRAKEEEMKKNILSDDYEIDEELGDLWSSYNKTKNTF